MTLDISEVEENELIQRQLDLSVQEFPSVEEGLLPFGFDLELFERRPLLSPVGYRQRLDQQHAWYHKEGNGMFQGANSGLAKRVQSLPYIIESPEGDGDQWDMLIRYANFDTWESFLSELITAYHTYDIGAFVEIIAPGDPRSEPTGAATGMAILDSRHCWPTGDPEFPVIYFDRKNQKHVLHRSRVVQFVDMEEKNERLPMWGQSALTRAISAINKEVLLDQYERASLDDMPAPGFATLRNINENKFYEAVKKMKELREKDDDVFGRLVLLFGLSTQADPAIDITQFQKEFSGFDPDKVAGKNAKYIANALGIDLQDFWELTGQGIGTATQSEILAEKSKGRGFGVLIKRIERMINDILPDEVEFKFKYRNEEEDLERAQTAQAWATAIQMLTDYTTPDERRILATNQIEALKDATLDEQGNVIRFDDADPKTPEQVIVDETAPEVETEEDTPDENFVSGEEKDFRKTSVRFKRVFNETTRFLKDGVISPGGAHIMIMDTLRKEGKDTYLDGVRRTGKRNVKFDERGENKLASWLIKQRPLVARYVADVQSGKYTDKQLQQKGLQWVNGSLSTMLYEGMSVAPRQMWRWVTNFAKENCITCLRLHGQVHQMKTYTSRGLVPKSVRLVCHGDFCGCRLVKDDGPAKGRIRAVRFVRRALFISAKSRRN
jgi:hypothetical protein